jgi:hypothetical protein
MGFGSFGLGGCGCCTGCPYGRETEYTDDFEAAETDSGWSGNMLNNVGGLFTPTQFLYGPPFGLGTGRGAAVRDMQIEISTATTISNEVTFIRPSFAQVWDRFEQRIGLGGWQSFGVGPSGLGVRNYGLIIGANNNSYKWYLGTGEGFGIDGTIGLIPADGDIVKIEWTKWEPDETDVNWNVEGFVNGDLVVGPLDMAIPIEWTGDNLTHCLLLHYLELYDTEPRPAPYEYYNFKFDNYSFSTTSA